MSYLNEKKITLISAAPGCGKSTAVAHYLTLNNHSYCWLNLSDEINQEKDLLSLIFKGLETCIPEIRPREPRDLADYLQTAEKKFTRDNPFILVMDNFHLANREPALLETTGYLTEILPDTFRLFLISREEIQYSFRKARAGKDLVEIGNSDFVFDLEEIRGLFQQVYKLNLEEGLYERILSVTGGWITAIAFLMERLLHLSEREQKLLLEDFLEEKTLPELDDYFTHDALEEISPEEVNLLIRLNAAGRIAPELVEEFSHLDGKEFLY